MGLGLAVLISKLNHKVADSPFGRYFRLDGCGHKKEREGTKFTTEIRAGLATFLTMAYIISTNAIILADSGGPCHCDNPQGCSSDPAYMGCLYIVKKDLITATATISCL